MIPTLIEYRLHLIALFIALIPVYFTIYVFNRNKFSVAAKEFRNIILAELKGLIPTEGLWKQEEYPRFSKSIPVIKRAAYDFRGELPFYRKRGFNKAVMEYCKQSQNINWNQAVLDALDSDKIAITQKERFANCVYHLLSFTE